ncbi:MAG: LamG-like jellyroll fold domain-containing protein [Dehalogenimonas sp.]
MNSRQDVLTSQTENFGYDSLNRLVTVSGAYSQAYAYDEIGNLTAMNGATYTYGAKPHAVTMVDDTSYAYDNNGNMTARDNQTISWDIENRPVSISVNGESQSYGLSFDGNDSVSISGSALKVGESQGGSASYEFWVKLNSPGAQSMIIMSKGSINPYVGTNGTLYCDFAYANDTFYYASTGINVANGAWHYVVCTHDGTTSKVYVDGVLRASETHAQLLADTYDDALVLGEAVWGGNYFTGALDEIRISSTARSLNEITATWDSGDGQSFSPDGNTVALYHMNDQASTLTDSSGNGLNGTISGATYTTGFGFPGGGIIAQYIYDGDGKRIKKTESGQTIVYINQYFEKNLTTGTVTTSYYLGGRLVAEREGTDLRYIHQDSLNSSTLVTDDTGAEDSSMKFTPFGECRNSTGDLATDKLFTGQRLDSTGLYYYGARYYDPAIGRFISADTIVQSLIDPQFLNRYQYGRNNPLKWIDPSGHAVAPPMATPWDDIIVDPGPPLSGNTTLVGNNGGVDLVVQDPNYGTVTIGNWVIGDSGVLDNTALQQIQSLQSAVEPDNGTYGIGINTHVMFLNWDYSFEAGVVWDNRGNFGVVASSGAGGGYGFDASVGVQIQHTNASTIYQLQGPSQVTGGSINPVSALSLGGEWIAAESYQGWNFNIGASACYHIAYIPNSIPR